MLRSLQKAASYRDTSYLKIGTVLRSNTIKKE